MIDLSGGEALIPLSQVPKLPFVPLRRCGRKLHPATVFRWAQKGLKGVRLEYVQFGGAKVTTVAALERFFARLSGSSWGPQSGPSNDRERRIREVERELDKAGI